MLNRFISGSRSSFNKSDFPKWLSPLLIVIVVLGIAAFFLWETPDEVPMGDSYIHFVYARNLVDEFEYTYNPGLQEGIGTTSVLWVAALAFFYFFGISPVIASKILGIGLLGLSSWLVYNLSKSVLHKYPQNQKKLFATITALLVSLSGSYVWTALSGMETILFIALGLLSLYFYSRKKWLSLGIVLGLFALTRIEGIVLAGSIILIETLYYRRLTKPILKILVPMGILLIPWLIYLQTREGLPITATFQGRQANALFIGDQVSNQAPQIAWLLEISPLLYFFSWTGFLLFFGTGAVSLPGPKLGMDGSQLASVYSIPYVSVLISLVIIIPLLMKACMHLWKKRRHISFDEPTHRLLIIAGLWIFLHNLAYSIVLPKVGSAGRYASLNQFVFWLFLIIGVFALKNQYARLGAAFSIIVLLGIGLQYWKNIYAANVKYSINVRIASARYIDEKISHDALIGTNDKGAIRYYSHQRIVELFGYINKEIFNHLESGGTFADFISEMCLDYVMLFGYTDDIGIGFAEGMNLFDDERFELVEEAVFSVSNEEWMFGIASIESYLPAQIIYRIDWLESSNCDP